MNTRSLWSGCHQIDIILGHAFHEFFGKNKKTMKSTLASGEDIMISGFGKFQVNEKESRKGRNPATGGAMMLKKRRVVTFKCSGKLRDQVNKAVQEDNLL